MKHRSWRTRHPSRVEGRRRCRHMQWRVGALVPGGSAASSQEGADLRRVGENPYVQITVSENAVREGRGHNRDNHQGGEDIIPIGPSDPDGRNWDLAGQAIYNDGCLTFAPISCHLPVGTESTESGLANQRRYVARVIQTSELRHARPIEATDQRRTGGVSVRHCVSHSCSCCGHWRSRCRSHSGAVPIPIAVPIPFAVAVAVTTVGNQCGRGHFSVRDPSGDPVEEVGGTLARFVALLNQDEFIDDRRGVLPPVGVRVRLEDGDHPADRRRHSRRRHRGPMPCSPTRLASAPSSSAPEARCHVDHDEAGHGQHGDASTPPRPSSTWRSSRADFSLTPVSRCWMLATFGLVVADGEVFFGQILRLSPRRCFANAPNARNWNMPVPGDSTRCRHLDDVVAVTLVSQTVPSSLCRRWVGLRLVPSTPPVTSMTRKRIPRGVEHDQDA